MTWREGSPAQWGNTDRDTVPYDSAIAAWKAVERRSEASIQLHRAGIMADEQTIREARDRILELNRSKILRTIDMAVALPTAN